MATETSPNEGDSERKWQPLSSRQRRVLGVLIEKAKTTPDAYPLSLNALTNGCNQKSNRTPQMSLSLDEAEETLEELRELGAVAEVQTSGRVAKFKHYAYDWLGVDKTEIAVMAELLLRGEQTIGELRGRAARMEAISDLSALKPVIRGLEEKGLLLTLTPEGRGQVVSHAIYKPREIEELMKRFEGGAAPRDDDGPPSSTPSPPAPRPTSSAVTLDMFNQLQLEVTQLRAELSELRRIIDE